ncbi:MAG: efflux RND transporter permease subunit, partial [Verrucomicrobiota bacterium]
FVPMALSVGFAMIASYVLSSTLVPVLTVWMVRAHRQQEIETAKKSRGAFERFQSGFGSLVTRCVQLRWLVIAGYAVAAGLIIWLCGSRLGVEIFPKTDTGQFAVRFRAPSGTQVGITEGIAKSILATIAREAGGADNVEFSIGMVGVHNSSFPVNLVHLWNGGPEEGWLAVQLKREAGVKIEPFEERLRQVLAQELPNVRLSFEPQDIVTRVMSFGSPTPIEVAVSGPNLKVSQGYAEKVLARMKELPFLRDVQIAQTLDYPTVNVDINRERAGVLGVKVDDVTKSLVAATTSSRFTVANFWADPASGISFNLQVQIPESKTQTTEDLKNIPVSAEGGKTVLLRNVATINQGTAVGTYERYNMARVVSVTANVHGTDLGNAVRELKHALADVGAPPDAKTKLDLRGQVVPLNQLLGGFRTGLIITVVVIFLLLAANFQSLRLSFVAVSTVPATIAGVVLALWLTGTTLNIQSAMGAIMAIGVAVANAILFVTFAERERIAGGAADVAAIGGARSRLRPILMTSLAMIAGMLPLAFGFGEGGDQTAPLGRAVIGGLAVATLSTLLVLPAMFTLLRRRSSTKSRSLDPNDPLSGHFVSSIGHD